MSLLNCSVNFRNKLQLILYQWNPDPPNLLIIWTKTCFPIPDVTVIFFLYFPLGFLNKKMARKAKAQNEAYCLCNSLNSNFLKS